ncbi:hypothetical protein KIPB_007539 [Kipferlia bialata]|uniref:Uncharacterized protein n=1 Tax=Kipferlia bialata TaxID=797122 RepID=A0A9K3D120_9EUKA|nr:hypothetical protein KIPB_007539 [Kipferlia bialata]|eukprot:g7539.t1
MFLFPNCKRVQWQTINMSFLPPPCRTVEELRLLIEEHKAVCLDVEKCIRDRQSLRSDDSETIRKLTIHSFTLAVRRMNLESQIDRDYMILKSEKEKRVERRRREREADKRRAKVYKAREERLFKTAHLPNFLLGSALSATTSGKLGPANSLCYTDCAFQPLEACLIVSEQGLCVRLWVTQ